MTVHPQESWVLKHVKRKEWMHICEGQPQASDFAKYSKEGKFDGSCGRSSVKKLLASGRLNP